MMAVVDKELYEYSASTLICGKISTPGNASHVAKLDGRSMS
jgi:hypothetical protein